jgi:hypothetical protein
LEAQTFREDTEEERKHTVDVRIIEESLFKKAKAKPQ